MSDPPVHRLLEEMEARLDDPAALLDTQALEDWNRRFREAAEGAVRDPGWNEVLVRAHRLGTRVEAALADLRACSGTLKAELESQGKGERALRAYAPPRS